MCSMYQPLEADDDDDHEEDDRLDRALVSPTQLIFYAPRIFEDGVVNVSDHKTCALLMTRMKEANRQPSPSQ
ncbi:unnamed protein product [Nippostrongylus brasiliensis]|uniref:Ubiquitinyl hydrolase 1 n=1 Tax=Nippostrongylus brasiliensis TaxID=27835 RepID=A0A0N4Y536_NIPBR|nr:unnamed protein product [Nippostrongylus brasiliensis]